MLGAKIWDATQPDDQALGFIARDRWPQLNCRLRHMQVELNPRLWLPGKLSVANGAGEARAPPVIQALIGGLVW